MANYTRKFTDEQRRAIADDIRQTAGTPDGSYRKIAARHNVKSLSTIQAIAKEFDLADRWQEGQANTAAATSVKQTNAAALRADLQVDLLHDAQEIRRRLWSPDGVPVWAPGQNKDGFDATAVIVTKNVEAGPREIREAMAAVGIASSKSVELARLEAEQAGAGEATGLLEQFEKSLLDARHRRDQAASENP